MARIPDRIRVSAQRRMPVSARAAGATDLGLGSLARELEGVAQEKTRTAEVEAQAAFTELEGRYTEVFRPAAETYDGRAPGFARDRIADYDRLAGETRGKLSADGQAAFDALNLKGRAAVFDRAWALESQVSGERVRRARQQAEQVQVVSSAAAFRSDYVKAREEAWRGLDFSQPGAADKLLSLYDERARATLEAAPEHIRPSLELVIANDRADEVLRLQAGEQRLRDAHTLAGASQALDALTGAVVSDPDEYEAALAKVPQVLALLPPEARVQLEPKVRQSLASARFGALMSRGDFDRVNSELDSGKWDQALGADMKAQLKGRVVAELNSDAKELARLTGEEQLASSVASILETGQPTDFDPNSLAILGPAAVAAARAKIEDARAVFAATKGIAGRTPKDAAAILETLKPKPGDPDFARKQAAYELGVQQAQKAQALQLSDPASAAHADPASATLWAKAASGEDAAAATAYASDVLRRQAAWGLSAGQQRILPAATAKQLAANATNAPPGEKAQALAAVYAYASRFGPHGGRVLNEITRAGLDAADAAVLNFTDADPVALGAYVRGKERGGAVKLEPSQKTALESGIRAQLEPLVRSLGATSQSQILADGLVAAATTAAKGYIGDGQSVGEAAKAAARPYLDRYAFVDNWRMPGAVAGRKVPGFGDRMQDREEHAKHVPTSATAAARIGARLTLADLVNDGGADLYPRNAGPGLTEAQAKRLYADVISDRGRWVTTADEGGLVLVLPDPRGGMTPVLAKDGKPVVRTWDQLFVRQQRKGPPQ